MINKLWTYEYSNLHQKSFYTFGNNYTLIKNATYEFTLFREILKSYFYIIEASSFKLFSNRNVLLSGINRKLFSYLHTKYFHISFIQTIGFLFSSILIKVNHFQKSLANSKFKMYFYNMNIRKTVDQFNSNEKCTTVIWKIKHFLIICKLNRNIWKFHTWLEEITLYFIPKTDWTAQ